MGMIEDGEREILEEEEEEERQRQQLQEEPLVLQSMTASEKLPAGGPVVSLFVHTRSRSSVRSNIGLVLLRSS